MSNEQQIHCYMRLKEVLNVYPVSKSTWWKGIKAGKYPQPIKISDRLVAWHSKDIEALIASRLLKATHEVTGK